MNKEMNPTAKTSMIIRRPVNEVFDSFVDPEKITKFWLSKTTGPLGPGKSVTWHFMVEGAVTKMDVLKFELNKQIDFKWEDGSVSELRFDKIDDNKSIIDIKTYGFAGTPEEMMEAAIDNTSGFTIVICDLKTYLEEGRSMNICRDKAELITREM
jgi:uncharacterized protein YndB with AHSA1/START domain